MKDKKINKEIRILKEKIKELEKTETEHKQEIEKRKLTEEALQKSEERFRLITENTGDLITLQSLDLKATYTFVSPSIKAMSGYEPEELLGRSAFEFIHPDDKKKLFPLLKKYINMKIKKLITVKEPSSTEKIEYRVKDKSGNWRYAQSVGSILGNQLLFITRDITKRKRAEEALKESEEKYRFISENTSSLIAVTTLDLIPKYIYISPSHKNIMGYSSEDLIGKKAMDFIHPEDKKKLLQLLIKYIGIKVRQSFKKEKLLEGLTIEYRVKDKKGNWHYLESIINHYENKIIFVSTDITERKQTDEELKKYCDDLEESVKKRTFTLEEKTKEINESQQALSLLLEDVNESRAELETKTNELNISLKNTEDEKDKIDAILKSIGDGLVVTDLDNRIILMNHIVEDLLNIRLSEVLNKPLLSIITEENLRKKLNFTPSKVKGGYQFDFELLGKNSKNPNVYSAKASIIKDKKNREIGIIIVFRDVTREREINRLKSEFISTAAHELRTPLTSIQGFSEILKIRDDLDDEKRKRFLTYINKQAVNLGNIISDLLDISRIESGMGFSLKKKKCKISDCILRVFSIYKISHPNHSFYFYLPDKETEVFVDIVKMEQVTENILSNAVKYSPYGGEIRIKGKILENKYMVSVEDKGIGMTPKQVEKIFEKFFRGDSSDTATEGTGLGMSIVKHIIEDHKGKIWVESKLGKGTKICFTIPMRLKRMIKRRSKIIENE